MIFMEQARALQENGGVWESVHAASPSCVVVSESD